jgi:hypothetical protein
MLDRWRKAMGEKLVMSHSARLNLGRVGNTSFRKVSGGMIDSDEHRRPDCGSKDLTSIQLPMITSHAFFLLARSGLIGDSMKLDGEYSDVTY